MDVDGEVLQKDVLAYRNANLHEEKRAQREDFELTLSTLQDKAKRIEQANEEQVRCRSVHSSSVGGVGGVRARVCLHACTFAGVRMCGCAGCVHVRG